MIIEFPKIISGTSLFSWKFHCEIEKITINLEASISTWKRQFRLGNFTTDLETRYQQFCFQFQNEVSTSR